MTSLLSDLAAGPALVLASNPMLEKLELLVPESILFVVTAITAMFFGLSRSKRVREAVPYIALAALVAAGVAALFTPDAGDRPLAELVPLGKVLVAVVGGLLVLLTVGTVDREFEEQVDRGARFDPINSNRAEFYAFLLFSLTGLMLVFTADDLIWLFLALELTSLPTYVMVSISSARSRSQEAGVKYFFLGAFGASVFLYGFALLYGAAGTTLLFSADPGQTSIASVLAEQAATGGLSTIAILGLVLSAVGICFKIAAVPMHFYTPDVYEGAATPVAALLAFVPKAAGFVALLLLAAAVGWGFSHDAGGGTGLPEPLHLTLWIVAALTMTVGNVLAILQNSVKRILAYSSIAHSGYMLVGVIAGPGDPESPASNGVAAVVLYLLIYGVSTLGAFAVLACLERDGREEIDTVEDIQGLCARRPALGWAMVLSAASLLGLPPLLGFFGKLYLFTAAMSAGEIALVVVMGLNSAIAAFYYLRLVFAPWLAEPDDRLPATHAAPFPSRAFVAVVSAAGAVALVPFVDPLLDAAHAAAGGEPAPALEPIDDLPPPTPAAEVPEPERAPPGTDG